MSTTAAATIFGVRLHELPSWERVRQVCEGFLDGDRTFRIYTPNPEILLRAREDRSYAGLLNDADLALPDGSGVALLETLRTRRRVRRWPGVEIGGLLLSLAAERDAPVVFRGGALGSGDRAAAHWRERLPGIRVEVVGAGWPIRDDGRAATPEREVELVERIRDAEASIVLVGLGAPKQERWIARHGDDLPSVRIAMGIGGAFEMWAGKLRRAPDPLRRLGLEWAWRLALEPHRLPRVVRAAIVFPYRALTDRTG